jgi:mono/diheme cytochrome c family protein
MKRVLVEGFVMILTIALAFGVVMANGDPAKGKASFDQLCASCHGSSGKGDGAAAAALSPKPRDLTDKQYVSGLKDDYIKKMVKEGGQAVGKSPLMPPMGSALKEADIENVIAYVRALAK